MECMYCAGCTYKYTLEFLIAATCDACWLFVPVFFKNLGAKAAGQSEGRRGIKSQSTHSKIEVSGWVRYSIDTKDSPIGMKTVYVVIGSDCMPRSMYFVQVKADWMKRKKVTGRLVLLRQRGPRIECHLSHVIPLYHLLRPTRLAPNRVPTYRVISPILLQPLTLTRLCSPRNRLQIVTA